MTNTLRVRLVWRCAPPKSCLPIDVVQKMQEEVERIWLGLDVRINWVDPRDAAWRRHDRGTLMVFLEESDPPWIPKRGLLLGATHHPAVPCALGVARVWVGEARRHAGAVRVNGSPPSKLSEKLGDFMLARVLGRILAHEIGHYLLRSTGHSPNGLMRAELTRREVLEPVTPAMYGLDRSERERLLRCIGEQTTRR